MPVPQAMNWEQPYRHARMPVLGHQMVAASQPLAAQAGLRMLAQGGNAVDAAVAAAAALAVVHPTNNGLGGDLFALVKLPGRSVAALDSSGRSAAALDPQRFAGAPMPWLGWDTVTVPGVVGGWEALTNTYGRLGFDTVLAPAIDYARRGWPVGVATAGEWASAPSEFVDYPELLAAFLPEGRAPRPGETFRLAGQAGTLERIAEHGSADFYRGQTAELICAHAARAAAPLAAQDLADFEPAWQEPISIDYHGVEVCQVGPPTQGITTLIALGILARCADSAAFTGSCDSADAVHLAAEAMKLASAVVADELADPAYMRVGMQHLLADDVLRSLADRVSLAESGTPEHGPGRPGGTVYLAAGDADGMLVSLIQSCYFGFGSGIVVPGAGINLHNRGAGFTTDSGHPNQVGPRKKPFHTIMPGLALDSRGDSAFAFGVVGGPMQPQGNLQLLLRLIDGGQNPQAALDAPRWRVEKGLGLAFEDGFAPEVVNELARRGHQRIGPGGLLGGFGAGQIIQQCGGLLVGGSDGRKEGQAVTL